MNQDSDPEHPNTVAMAVKVLQWRLGWGNKRATETFWAHMPPREKRTPEQLEELASLAISEILDADDEGPCE